MVFIIQLTSTITFVRLISSPWTAMASQPLLAAFIKIKVGVKTIGDSLKCFLMVTNSVWCLFVYWNKKIFFCRFQTFCVCFQNNGINFECACCIAKKIQHLPFCLFHFLQCFLFLRTLSNTIFCESYFPEWDIMTCKIHFFVNCLIRCILLIHLEVVY